MLHGSQPLWPALRLYDGTLYKPGKHLTGQLACVPYGLQLQDMLLPPPHTLCSCLSSFVIQSFLDRQGIKPPCVACLLPALVCCRVPHNSCLCCSTWLHGHTPSWQQGSG